jgi:hypothetical protein
MKRCVITLAAVFFLSAAGNSSKASDFAPGGDLSFPKQAEDRGTVFKDGIPQNGTMPCS